MKLNSEELVKEFLESQEDITLSLQELKQIVYSPWEYLKNHMTKGNLEEIRFKYFGKFFVRKGRATWLLANLEKESVKRQITGERYDTLKHNLTEHIKK